MSGKWSKARPKKSGYYWYKFNTPGAEPDCVLWNENMKWMQFAGDELIFSDGNHDIKGMFWSEEVLPPPKPKTVDLNKVSFDDIPHHGYRCSDGFCGALDCSKCHPENVKKCEPEQEYRYE